MSRKLGEAFFKGATALFFLGSSIVCGYEAGKSATEYNQHQRVIHRHTVNTINPFEQQSSGAKFGEFTAIGLGLAALAMTAATTVTFVAPTGYRPRKP